MKPLYTRDCCPWDRAWEDLTAPRQHLSKFSKAQPPFDSSALVQPRDVAPAQLPWGARVVRTGSMDRSDNMHSLLLKALSCCQALEVIHTSSSCCKPLQSVVTAAFDFLTLQELTCCWLALPFCPFFSPFWVLSQCWFKQLHLKGMRSLESNWPG